MIYDIINEELQRLAGNDKEELADLLYEEMMAEYWNWFMGMVQCCEREEG